MRKIFRMQYEPCNGKCYAPIDVIDLSEIQDDPKRVKVLVEKLTMAHDPLCGNKNIRYGIDLDEENGIYVASFWHYGKLELLSGKGLPDLLERFCDFVVEFFNSEQGQKELDQDRGLGHDVCEHGQDDDLARFMLQHSGIPMPQGVDEYLREIRSLA